jgi:hypothetical protein
VTVDQLIARPPGRVKAAIIIYAVSGVAALVVATIFGATALKLRELLAGPAAIVAIGMLLYKIYRGRNWARIVLLLLTALDLATYGYSFTTAITRSLAANIAALGLHVAGFLAAALLVGGSNGAWFTSRKES